MPNVLKLENLKLKNYDIDCDVVIYCLALISSNDAMNVKHSTLMKKSGTLA